MEEGRYLQDFVTPSELGLILEQKYLNKDIRGIMITKIKTKDFKNIPLSRTTTNNIEVNVPVKVIYQLFRKGDTIKGDLFIDDIDKRILVISNGTICENVNRHYVIKIIEQQISVWNY